MTRYAEVTRIVAMSVRLLAGAWGQAQSRGRRIPEVLIGNTGWTKPSAVRGPSERYLEARACLARTRWATTRGPLMHIWANCVLTP